MNDVAVNYFARTVLCILVKITSLKNIHAHVKIFYDLVDSKRHISILQIIFINIHFLMAVG